MINPKAGMVVPQNLNCWAIPAEWSLAFLSKMAARTPGTYLIQVGRKGKTQPPPSSVKETSQESQKTLLHISHWPKLRHTYTYIATKDAGRCSL